jgi:hypothetical protein
VADVTQTNWQCPNCGEARATPFCPRCGEQPLGPHDLTLRDLVVKLGQSISSVDGKALATFKALLLHPGQLTVAHLKGQRRSYLGPLKVFLIANALFFAVQSATHTNILSSPLQSHLYQQDWQELARSMVAAHLREEQLTLAQFAPAFDTAVVLYAKSLIILMCLVLAPALALMFWRNRMPIGAHIVFALHLYAFVLLLFCFSLGIAEIDLLMGGAGLASPALDTSLSLLNLLASMTYLYLAIGKAYQASGARRAVAAIMLAATVGAIVIGYRFLMFLITLAWT